MKEKILISQKELKIIRQTNNELIVKAKYGPSKETKIPFSLNEKISFFLGAIIGDGHIKKEKFQITFECTNKNLVEQMKNISKKIFDRTFNIHPRKPRKNQKDSYQLYIDSKAIHKLLTNVFEIPKGKKSNIVQIPREIKIANKSIKSSFLLPNWV